ncbi:L-selectin-like isoform X2 [Polyodon spathula]|uniref:L-selectin-like isoform X2 n=1 Tax=Polyodon spathula TaxID=7913 RepID=UPI001B7E9F14|nr:L-selectin-like isoform X2 [Polyodon spathula]
MKFQNEKPEFQQRNTIWILILISYEFTMLGCAEGWTYHKAARQMPWENARQWCQNHYTDMVAIQNKKEIAYLNEVFPMVKGYYWIGIRKLNGNWVWIATNKTLSQEAENWATAQCNQSTCSGHGECTETINNYTCNCEKGFDGKHCQDVVKCEALSEPDDRILTCSGLYGNFSYNSTCQFHCSEGFALNGSSMVTCNSSGDWTEPIPMCTAVKFEEPSKEGQIIINPDKFANVSFNSTCKFQCLEVQNDHLDYRHLTMAVVGASILATSLIIFFLLSRMRKKKHLHARLPGMEPPEVAQSNL